MSYELYHYGVKGMKWGVRRYQNPDGSLTAKGKRHYDKMTDDKLRKTIRKQVKKARVKQRGWGTQWEYNHTIGEHSKAAKEKYNKDYREHMNSDAVKKAQKEMRRLDKLYDQGKIDPDQYDKQWNKLREESVYRPDLDATIYFRNNGREYSKEYIETYGKNTNIGYIRDLGYDEVTAKEFTERIIKANNKLVF